MHTRRNCAAWVARGLVLALALLLLAAVAPGASAGDDCDDDDPNITKYATPNGDDEDDGVNVLHSSARGDDDDDDMNISRRYVGDDHDHGVHAWGIRHSEAPGYTPFVLALLVGSRAGIWVAIIPAR